MSSSPHSTVVPSDSDNENTFSSTNILNYFPASPGNISPNSSDDFTKYLLDILLFPPLHDDPYIQAYDVIPPSQVIIALPAIVPPPMSDSRSFFPPKEISSPEGAKTPVESPNPMSTSSSVGSSSPVRSTTSPPNYLFNESIFAELDNSLWIISRPLGSKPVPEEFNNAGSKRTSTSAAPAMTQDANPQLVCDSWVAIALKAQAANLANTDNTNKNTGTSRTPVARKGINDHKRKIEDRGNTTTNNNYPKHNNNNHSNNHINKNNYPDNHNKNNHNNDYHQQQHRRQETIRTYPTKKYHGNLPLCTRCTLHHTGVCTVKCQNCNKVGHLTRNCRSKGPAMGSNLLSVSVTCHACGEKGHYKSQCSSKTDNGTISLTIAKEKLKYRIPHNPKKEIWLDDKLNYMEESVEIMDREVKQL
ncbi:reverse transcriptase domain-containing protein [Tanacetum coccineum]|uniref:Reverse transcriptase domain-containing protein n=1 Tax=Tanacetum coccineum TaxID=301880 RepID=A0ABQ5BWH4_9ASTR